MKSCIEDLNTVRCEEKDALVVLEDQTWDLGGVKPVLSSRNRPGHHLGPFYTGRVPRIFSLGSPGFFWALVDKKL